MWQLRHWLKIAHRRAGLVMQVKALYSKQSR
nr:MAG TPA: hypothetical protein [Caudoviricetes sp.]